MKKLSAVIACYNDEQSIPIMYERLVAVFQKINVDYEIIFVNDGSPDNTQQVLKEITAKDLKVVAITHSRNFGSQMAFTSGAEVTTGDAVILLDGDLQDPPELIEDFYNKWIEGYQVVYGVRSKREEGFLIQFARKIFYYLLKKLSYIDIPLNAGDFSLIDKKVINVIKQMPERDRFIRGLRAWAGFKQTGVDYIRPERMFGKTHNNLLRNIWWARKGIFSFSYVPLELITYLALIIVVMSFVGIILEVILKFLLPDVPQGIPAIIIIVLFLGGIQLLCLGILGEYLGRIFEEVKQRPQFIVKEIINNPESKNQNTISEK